MSELSLAHYERYKHNLALAGRIESSLAGDENWRCVVLFYAALHLMSAYLAEKQNVRFDPSSAVHHTRAKALAKCSELRESPEKYRQLKDISESVRYDAGYTFT